MRTGTGEILRYRVRIAGDLLGSIVRAPYGHSGRQAQDSAGNALAHSGSGRYAKNRQAAVVDLLAALGITSRG
ncbi:hypothetical protein [Haloactinomyces albus]|uniref:Uncharacterized protein n=1 Tax=Haloactinomyces albus TaxID=1352928 RepID=A0AAE3ZGU4_9ACTN|nr:hypothetical protein [Haloactinomyces albus]MDR7304607.1 hypothetical protein [Haloactinomyces albus]